MAGKPVRRDTSLSAGQIKIYIVDDHPVVLDGLTRRLESDPRFLIVGHADQAEAAIDQVRDAHPEVILLDLSLPGLSGFEAIPLLKQASPGSGIVIFSMLGQENLIKRAIHLGALGYVLKGAGGQEIAEAILAAHQGQHYLSSEIKSKVVENFLNFCQANAAVNKYDLLTAREQQVFRLMVEGFSTAKIAKHIFLSPKTVEKHRSNIIKKLGIHETVGLVKYAMEIGILDPHSWPN